MKRFEITHNCFGHVDICTETTFPKWLSPMSESGLLSKPCPDREFVRGLVLALDVGQKYESDWHTVVRLPDIEGM